MWICSYKNGSLGWTYDSFFFDKHPILGSKQLNYLDFKSAVYIIKDPKPLDIDGIGLQ